jgi:protein O-mannosyl-transferase
MVPSNRTRIHRWLLLLALVVAVFVAYQPAWRGELLWDDDVHITKPELRSLEGLGRIWFDVGATLQYYPLLHTAFWSEYRLWGNATLGYHLVNLALHATAAVLVALVLLRLQVPGALLAAGIFALHPVQVESVAWISEQKNTLSTVFYLAAALMYLKFDDCSRYTSCAVRHGTRSVPASVSYTLALGLFVLAILSKTVTGTLPAALLVVFWWQRGKLSWRRDVLPLLPFFLFGAAGGAITAWWELKFNRCVGPEFDFTLIERFLLAARATWFHFWKLCWPAELVFIYPRWNISQAVWWQYLFPLAAVALLVALWSIRRQTRAPLAAALFFGGTLFPVSGFFNLYTFRYSLVANHYQYLASLGIITLAAAGGAMLLARVGLWRRPVEQSTPLAPREGASSRRSAMSTLVGPAICLALLAVLATLTWRQSRMYADLETLYQATIEHNPQCWLAYDNLGVLWIDQQRLDDGLAYCQKALAIKPDNATSWNSVGRGLMAKGQFDEAIVHFQQAVRLLPDFLPAHVNLGAVLTEKGRFDEAVAHCRVALAIQPACADAHYNLGRALAAKGDLNGAIAGFQQALRSNPDFVVARTSLALANNGLGVALAGSGRFDEASDHFQAAVRIKPDYAEAHNNLGGALARRGLVDEAIVHYRAALQVNSNYAIAHNNLALALLGQQHFAEAILHFQQALQLKPDYAEARNNLQVAIDAQQREVTDRSEGARNKHP